MDYEDSWSQDDLFRCFQNYNVNFGKEFCDSKFTAGADLMRCYSERNVPRGEEFCISNFETAEELIACYEDIPVYSQNYCDLKHYDKDSKLQCYREKVGLVLDMPFCDSKFESIDEVYQCYIDIGLIPYKNR